MADQEKQPLTHSEANGHEATAKAYERPELTKLGKLSELTLGAGSASNESGKDKA